MVRYAGISCVLLCTVAGRISPNYTHFDPFSMTLASSRDCYVTSLDGKEYLGLVSEYSAALFGHS